jgi:6-phosphogluconolactonase/glucosamine-6-phosphate isomerase/deaminase
MMKFPASRNRRASNQPLLTQEEAGFYLGIGANLDATGEQAAATLLEKYRSWHKAGRNRAETAFKSRHFCIAVGGGNTVKAVYRALLELHANDINWIEDVRFFFLEESTGEKNWVSAADSLAASFIRPLTDKLIRRYGINRINRMLGLKYPVMEEDLAEQLVEVMLYRINLAEVRDCLQRGQASRAGKLAQQESKRYQELLQRCLGSSMAFHMIVTGIGKDGELGAFASYTPALAEKRPGLVKLKQDNGATRIALNRGIIIRAECVALILAGTLKLKALGRFEMQEAAEFEQTVLETPVRMLRETREIAEKVYIFADDTALHFDEAKFEYREKGKLITTRAETREGSEEDGIHAFLLHGFMGLYSYINFLIRLPGAWTVSALHRGKHAKKLPEEEIFPHYAMALRKAIMQNWRSRRPTPVACHSIAGCISDHLLLSIADAAEGQLPEFENLKKSDQQLVEALRAGGLIHLATWAPSDIVHIADNGESLVAHLRNRGELDYSGPDPVYSRDTEGKLVLNNPEHVLDAQPERLLKFAKLPAVEQAINAMNRGMRYLLDKRDLQQGVSRREIPYGMRVVGGRLLKKVSFYGLLKEVCAALHDPLDYQQRHLRALDVIIKYDIPYLGVIHHDDFMVSANRHREEYDYLLQRRMEKDGVTRSGDIRVALEFLQLERESEDLPVDPLNPHLMLMSTSHEGDKLSRQVTMAITRFVKNNVSAAVNAGKTPQLPSISRWQKSDRLPMDTRKAG